MSGEEFRGSGRLGFRVGSFEEYRRKLNPKYPLEAQLPMYDPFPGIETFPHRRKVRYSHCGIP